MLRSRARTTPRLAMALLAWLTIAGATVVQGHASVTTPTATGQFAGGRVTGADGHLMTGSTAISAADANFTTGDVGFEDSGPGHPRWGDDHRRHQFHAGDDLRRRDQEDVHRGVCHPGRDCRPLRLG